MSEINIFAPRWHDRKILVANHKIGSTNTVHILSTNANKQRQYPEPFVVTGDWLRSWPIEQLKTRAGGYILVRAVPLDELLEVNVNAKA